jgi:hypothetical protein
LEKNHDKNRKTFDNIRSMSMFLDSKQNRTIRKPIKSSKHDFHWNKKVHNEQNYCFHTEQHLELHEFKLHIFHCLFLNPVENRCRLPTFAGVHCRRQSATLKFPKLPRQR